MLNVIPLGPRFGLQPNQLADKIREAANELKPLQDTFKKDSLELKSIGTVDGNPQHPQERFNAFLPKIAGTYGTMLKTLKTLFEGTPEVRNLPDAHPLKVFKNRVETTFKLAVKGLVNRIYHSGHAAYVVDKIKQQHGSLLKEVDPTLVPDLEVISEGKYKQDLDNAIADTKEKLVDANPDEAAFLKELFGEPAASAAPTNDGDSTTAVNSAAA